MPGNADERARNAARGAKGSSSKSSAPTIGTPPDQPALANAPGETPGSSSSIRAQVIERQQSALREITVTTLITIVLFLGLHFSAQAVPLDGPSMQPGLHTNERVLVNSLAYALHGPQRGDVIVFHPPSALNERYIKRVIGVPGDRITLTPNHVIIDGVTLNEPYITPAPPGETENPEPQSFTLGPGQYFVMGDNRTNSQDSRYFGPISANEIIGQAEFVVWPLADLHGIDTYPETFGSIPSSSGSGGMPRVARR